MHVACMTCFTYQYMLVHVKINMHVKFMLHACSMQESVRYPCMLHETCTFLSWAVALAPIT